MNQMTLGLGLPPAKNPYGLFWCCGDCFPKSEGKHSLIWQPPDYKSGRCVYCGRAYTFSSRYGKDELVDELSKV